MARSRGGEGESKQGLIVTLVLFVLLSMFLGAMSYFAYAEKNDLARERQDAKDNLKRMILERDRERLLRIVYQNAIGIPGANKAADKQLANDLTALKVGKDRLDANDKTHAQVFEDEIKKLKGLTWDVTGNAPDKNYIDQVVLLMKQAENEAAARKQAVANLDQANKAFQDRVAALTQAKEAAEKAMQDTKKEVEDRIKKISDNYDTVVKQFQKSLGDDEENQKKLNALRKEKEEIEGKLQAALKDAEMKIKKIEEKIPQIDLLAYDQAKGKITRIEGTSTAYINLGRADLVRTGLTFSIFSVGAYKANAERKASIEVVEVIGDHLAKGRLTEVRNSAREPVLTGDLLYNPAWSPGMREHIAVAGMIDLTGDGRDGTMDFIRLMEKQGVAVDGFLDTRDVTVQGKGMNRQTGYLIIGEIPEFQAQEQIKEGDVRQERKISINKKIGEMREEAIRLGVTVVPARRFMALMGFKLPRTPASAEDWNANTYRPGAAAKDNKGGEMPGKGEKKEEMKKDEAKKDEK